MPTESLRDACRQHTGYYTLFQKVREDLTALFELHTGVRRRRNESAKRYVNRLIDAGWYTDLQALARWMIENNLDYQK